MGLIELKNRIKTLIDEFPGIILDSAMDQANTIADLNVKQLEVGKRADGNPITPEYQSDVYADAKMKMGSKAPKFTPNLYLEGYFYRGFYTKRTKTYLYTYSSDGKADKLNSKYHGIFGLTKESIGIMKPDTLSLSLKRSRQILFNT